MKRFMKAMAAMMLMVAVVIAAGCTKLDNSDNGGNNNSGENSGQNTSNNGSLDGYEWVDLGLPSGTLWATCNMGATLPNEYGSYFTWYDLPVSQWGGGWCVPTEEQWLELFNNTMYECTSQDGVNGYLITANDSRLFLPAAGYSTGDIGSVGYYWSSSSGADHPYAIKRFMCFGLDYYRMRSIDISSSSGGNSKFSVRRVCFARK